MSLNATEASSPSKHFVTVTPSDAVDLARLPKALYIGVTGNVTCQNIDGTSVLFTAVPAGTILPIRAKRILATGTTATGIVSLA